MQASTLTLKLEIEIEVEIYNSSFMNEIFLLRAPNTNLINERSQHRLNLDISNDNRVSLDNKSIGSFGPKI